MMKKLHNVIMSGLITALITASILFVGMRIFDYFKGADKAIGDIQSSDFIAPLTRQELKPLNIEIDFLDTHRTLPEVQTEVETDWGRLTFSTYGASLERMIAKRHMNGVIQEIPILFPVASTSRERHCFLIGLAEKTPYFYDFTGRNDTANNIELSYKVDTAETEIRKTFIIHKHINKIDLKLEVTPKGEQLVGVEPRIVYPSPFMPDLGAKDAISAVIVDKEGVFKKTLSNSLNMHQGWFGPRIFGSEDKYFVNTLIGDEHSFVQRAYYNLVGTKDLFSFLEGPVVKEPHTWYLSFYFGPKEVKSLMAVDDRLEKTLGYSGILAPISRFLLQVLLLLYGYFGNYGWAIVALIALMQLIMVPFTFRGEKSNKKAKEFKKKMAYIELRYKNDRDALARERAALIQAHGMPGLGGCLPVLLFRMPTFFALQQVLSHAIELYKAPFLWISDLSVPDPYYILPLLVAGGMFAQSLTVESGQRVQFMMIALVMGGVTMSLSAGLALYIAVSTALGVLQTAVLRLFKLA
ncbi:MAG: YidC/Oxa1 family insertase periplasmic-domain containing protein [Candidatus Dependentiae bacterium]|nr:YidC/Oxa1 family insertase periplasmic-domain containing protein [Candidatus Dependentiae bacterium]